MRNYQVMDESKFVEENMLRLTSSADSDEVVVTMSKEGAYVTFSASFGPMEVALRMRQNELARHLNHLQVVPGLAVTRQTGSANAYLSLGLNPEEMLVLRPTLVADASGRFSFNLVCTKPVGETIKKWVGAE